MTNPPVVLIVDDQPHVRLPLEYLVRSIPGVQVLTAGNGVEAVALAVKHRPLLVMLDVMMPLMDGYAAAQQIRQVWGDHPGQIWFLTARGSNLDTDQAKAVGAAQFITKPFDPDRVVSLVRQLLAARCESSGTDSALVAGGRELPSP
jgi:two-component system, OmpR family, alkaline phosphatase synthesis response regulator PhoP